MKEKSSLSLFWVLSQISSFTSDYFRDRSRPWIKTDNLQDYRIDQWHFRNINTELIVYFENNCILKPTNEISQTPFLNSQNAICDFVRTPVHVMLISFFDDYPHSTFFLRLAFFSRLMKKKPPLFLSTCFWNMQYE